MNPSSLKGSKVKQFVLHDRSTDTAAKLIAVESVVLGRKEISGIQGAIAKEFEGRAVNIIRSRLGDDVHGAAHCVTVFRCDIGGLKVEFLYRIRVGKGEIGIQISIVVTSPVKLIVDTAGARSIDVGLLLSRVDPTMTTEATVTVGLIDRSRRQKNQGLCSSPI